MVKRIKNKMRKKERINDLAINENKKYLKNILNVFQDIYFLEDEKLINFEKKNGVDRKKVLYEIEQNYKQILNIFKKYNLNISEYPKNLKGFYFVSPAETIEEIAKRNEFPISRVREIYVAFAHKHHLKNLRNIEKSNPKLYEKLFDSTERYIDRQRSRELKKFK